jgi:DNA mismatch repair protein MutS
VFDLALAPGLANEGTRVVVNDFELAAPERILVVTGPNQGGKTTFARTLGQLHHLARIGVLVPGTAARVPLVDGIFTHFERQEEVEDLTSKLEDDLLRIHRILETATADSLLILNESFSSTTVEDQLSIGRRVVRRILDRGPLCVMVTFLDELASLDPRTVSMVSTVDPDEPARRTFEIVRRPADGLAYAMAIAEKHRLTYPSVKARIAR